MRKAHPAWTEAKVLAAAIVAFESAAMPFFVETLNVARELRPNASWGFWGFPCPMSAGTDTRMSPLWKAQSGFFPSIYLQAGGTAKGNAGHVAGVTAHSSALRDRYAPKAVVRPFAWAYYIGGDKGLLASEDMAASVEIPAQNSADGVILLRTNFI